MVSGHLSAFVDTVGSSTDLSLRSQPGEPDPPQPLPRGCDMGHLLSALPVNNKHKNTKMRWYVKALGVFHVTFHCWETHHSPKTPLEVT